MARSSSGRLVIDIDPQLKSQLHAKLAAEGRTVKDWFIEHASRFVDPQELLPLQTATLRSVPIEGQQEMPGVAQASKNPRRSA